MWKVGTETISGKTNYFLISDDGTRMEGGFDTQLWAERWASYINDMEEKRKGVKQNGRKTNNSR